MCVRQTVELQSCELVVFKSWESAWVWIGKFYNPLFTNEPIARWLVTNWNVCVIFLIQFFIFLFDSFFCHGKITFQLRRYPLCVHDIVVTMPPNEFHQRILFFGPNTTNDNNNAHKKKTEVKKIQNHVWKMCTHDDLRMKMWWLSFDAFLKHIVHSTADNEIILLFFFYFFSFLRCFL